MVAQSKSRSEAQKTNSLVDKMASKFSIDPEVLLETLKATAFSQGVGSDPITNEQMYSLLIVSDQYNLNPFTKEIYAFPAKNGGIVPVVGVDGWNRIANEHPQFDGVEFVYSDELMQPQGAATVCHAWIEAVVYRKDRTRPIRVREYLDECYRLPYVNRNNGYVSNGPWQSHPKRLLRHKAEIQCYRVGFSFVGIYDEDEASRIIEGQVEEKDKPTSLPNVVPMKSVDNLTLGHKSSTKVNDFLAKEFNKEDVDAFLSKLIERARVSGQWQAAEELVRNRLSGEAFKYALAELTEEAEKQKSNSSLIEKVDSSDEVLVSKAIEMSVPSKNQKRFF